MKLTQLATIQRATMQNVRDQGLTLWRPPSTCPGLVGEAGGFDLD
jgi:hypothetical protein